MRLALATLPTHAAFMNDLRWPNMLVSFTYAESFDALTYVPEQLVLDSGAFSAWSRGADVDLHAYRDWALRVRERVPHALVVNLDVIPGAVGRSSSAAERSEAMRASLSHADELRAAGLPVMEVFHQDEPAAFLRQLVARRQPGEVLGISPRNDMPTKARRAWLLRVLGLLSADGPNAVPPCHGLAVTSRQTMLDFPWYSIDSSTWAMVHRWGEMEHPTRGGRVSISEAFSGHVARKSLRGGDHKSEVWAASRLAIRQLDDAALQATKLWEQRGITWKS